MATDGDERDETGGGKPANIAPDAVKDPTEKTQGKPGLGPQGDTGSRGGSGDEADPGGS